MSESDGMDDVLDGGMRQSLMIASRIAETLARRRQESQRQQEHQDAQAAHEAQARLAAERSAAHAALAPVEKDQWWDKAQPNDIATAHAVAEGWKDHDPTALAASEKIRQEVLTRYGIDTHDVGADAAYLESGIQTITTEKARQDALAAARKRRARRPPNTRRPWSCSRRPGPKNSAPRPQTLAPEMERHQVPVEYLANPELAQALQRAHNAKTPTAAAAADTEIKERLFLIGKDGINGPDIDQLRKETTANFNGAGDAPLQGSRVRESRQGMHEAKLLAEGGFRAPNGSHWNSGTNEPKRNSSPASKARPRDREPRHRQRQQPAQRPGPESRNQLGRRLRFSRTSPGVRRIPRRHRSEETQVRGRLAAATQRGHTPQRRTRQRQGAGEGAENNQGRSNGGPENPERPQPRVAPCCRASSRANRNRSRGSNPTRAGGGRQHLWPYTTEGARPTEPRRT